MKRIALLVVIILVNQACHKKGYPLFNKLATDPFLYQYQKAGSLPVFGELVVSADTTLAGIMPEEGRRLVLQAQSASPKPEISPRVSVQEKPIQAKKLSNQKRRPLFHEKTDEPKNRAARTLGIASLILGAAGLLLLIPTLITTKLFGIGLAGILLGVTGLVLAIIRALRLKKHPDASSNDTGDNAATIGVVLSATALVGGIMALGIVALINALTGF